MKRIIFLAFLLFPVLCFAGETIDDQTALGAKPADADAILIWDDSAGATKKVVYS